MWEQISSNRRKTFLLIILMGIILAVTGYAIGFATFGDGIPGLALAGLVWFFQVFISYFAGDAIFLKLSGARKIKPEDQPKLFNIVEEMKIASGLSHMPSIYIIDDPAPNAFATGRHPKNAAVAVTTGLLEKLNRDELQGVIAHEIGHVNNRDILYMTMVGAMMGAVVILADIGVRVMFRSGSGRSRTSSRNGGGQAQLVILVVALVLMILAPIIAQLVYFAVSRRREYLADAASALYTRYPEGLASALEKISGSAIRPAKISRVTAPMYIINPMKIAAGKLSDLSGTHPPTSMRVKVLRAMSGGADYRHYDTAYQQVTGKTSHVIGKASLEGVAGIAPIHAPSERDASTELTRHRSATDLMWKLNDYIFIACSCKTNLKIPPFFRGEVIRCPHCMSPHQLR